MATLDRLSIRTGTPEDAAFIRALGHEAFSEYSPNAARETTAMAARAHTLVATLNGEPSGFAVVELDSGEAHLSAIAVTTDARGTGVGRRLLHAAEAFARGRGATALWLATADSNLAALALFLGSGFRRRRRRDRYYARGQSAVVLEKEL